MFLIAYTTAKRCIRLRNSCQAFIAGRQDLRQETMNLFGIETIIFSLPPVVCTVEKKTGKALYRQLQERGPERALRPLQCPRNPCQALAVGDESSCATAA